MPYGNVDVGGVTVGRGLGAGAGALAFTGEAGIPWLVIGALTLLGAGLAILRLVPKREE